jgi:hypothetical protein
MTEGVNDNRSSQLQSSAGRPLVADPAKAHAVLFLHSFNDAQYFYGTDGFADLCHWADFTIETCLRNPAIGLVMIKSHPNINPRMQLKTRRTEEWLRAKYASEPRVVWLGRTSSLPAIAAVGSVVGITHHGSVAEELVFLGVPVIAFKNAAWREGYDFVRTWEKPETYAQLLGAISFDSGRVTANERDWLRQFVLEYRLTPQAGDPDNLLPFKRWRNACGSDPRGVSEERLQDELGALDSNAALAFLRFLSAHPSP